MLSTGRHAVTRIGGIPRRRRVWWRFLDLWLVTRRAIHYCTPSVATTVAWKVFLIGETTVLSAWGANLVTRHFAASALLTGVVGILTLTTALKVQIRAQQRRWRQAPGQLSGVPADDDLVWRKRMECRQDALYAKIDEMCEQAGMSPVDRPARTWTPVVYRGGKDPAA